MIVDIAKHEDCACSGPKQQQLGFTSTAGWLPEIDWHSPVIIALAALLAVIVARSLMGKRGQERREKLAKLKQEYSEKRRKIYADYPTF